MTKPGDRVGAIQSADDDEVKLFGYGIYEGRFTPPENVKGLNLDIPNPRIKLDNGETVYGCECWWGDEEDIKRMIGKRKIVEIKPERNEEVHTQE